MHWNRQRVRKFINRIGYFNRWFNKFYKQFCKTKKRSILLKKTLLKPFFDGRRQKGLFFTAKREKQFPWAYYSSKKMGWFVGVRSNLSGVPWYRRPVMKKLPTKPWSTHLFVFFFFMKKVANKLNQSKKQ